MHKTVHVCHVGAVSGGRSSRVRHIVGVVGVVGVVVKACPAKIPIKIAINGINFRNLRRIAVQKSNPTRLKTKAV